ncbi:MAG: MYXO-CTERM sorting domain-containing protein [Chloroflexi bacterium]|jgi:hypothetical protein|nr:MYXO-CTERM sorting domain-containing protein [Chloroflexota bacterium]
MRKLAGSGFILTLVMSHAGDALAGAPLCMSPVPVPTVNATVPANLPAVGIEPGWAPLVDAAGVVQYGTVGIRSTEVTLLDASLQPWPLREPSTGPVLRPTTLTVGARYWLSYPDACSEAMDRLAPGTPVRVSFTAGPPSELPASVGELVASANRRSSLEAWGSDYVFAFDGSYVDVALEMTPEMRAYSAVAELEVTAIDGTPGPFGEVAPAFRMGSTEAGAPCFRVALACDPPSPGIIRPQLAEGEHTVTIGASILGSEVAPASATTTFRLSCAAPRVGKNESGRCIVALPATVPTADTDGGSAATDSGTVPAPTGSAATDSGTIPAPTGSAATDSGTIPAPTGSAATDSGTIPAPTGSDGGMAIDAGSAPTPRQGDGGCRLAPGGTPSGVALLAAGVALALARRRRPRRP